MRKFRKKIARIIGTIAMTIYPSSWLVEDTIEDLQKQQELLNKIKIMTMGGSTDIFKRTEKINKENLN